MTKLLQKGSQDNTLGEEAASKGRLMFHQCTKQRKKRKGGSEARGAPLKTWAV